MYVRDCMPAVADIISESHPAPVELPSGASVDRHIATPAGEIFWPDVAPAWRVMELGHVTSVCLIARRNRRPDLTGCEAIQKKVNDLRDLLGEDGAAICNNGRVFVFNSDGTRVAVSE